MRSVSLIFGSLLALQAASGAEMAFPGAQWDEVTPDAAGLDPAKLKEAIRHLEANTGRDRARELVIVRYGRIAWRGDNIDHVHGVWSCTKSFTSTVLGLLIEDAKCELETKAASILPEMKEHYSAVTLRHFTTMTSGYRAEGDDTSGSYTHGPSPTPFVPSAQPLFPPGSAYAYWDSAMNQFGHALTMIAGEPLDQLFKRRIADPIQMNPAAWKWGDFGGTDGVRVTGGSATAADTSKSLRARWRALVICFSTAAGGRIVNSFHRTGSIKPRPCRLGPLSRMHGRGAALRGPASMDSTGGAMAKGRTERCSGQERLPTCSARPGTTTTNCL
jgi:CubicO group peptidase (beta-lactamase class C family)